MATEMHLAVVAVRKRSTTRWILVAAPEALLLERAIETADEQSASGPGWTGQILLSWRPPTGAVLLAEHAKRVETLSGGEFFKTYRSALLRLSDLGVRVYL